MPTEVAELGLIIDSSESAKGIKRIEDRLKRMGNTADKQTKKADAGFQKLKGSLFSLKGLLVSIGAVAFLKEAIGGAASFEKKMAEVSTLVKEADFNIKAMTKSVEAASVAFGTSAVEQAGAAYSIISAGASSAAEATRTLTAANKLALGGVTDINTAVDGLTSTLNAYGPTVGTAESVSDRFFVAVKAGKTTVEELSRSIGLVAPVAANLGISLDEVLAATAALTKGGIKTSISMAGLRQVMASILKPTSEAATAAKRLGLDFSVAGLKAAGGMQKFLAQVKTATKGSVEDLALLFGSVEALVPIIALAGNAGEDFEQILNDMAEAGGATEKAVEKMKKTFDYKFAVFKQGALAVVRDLGTKLLPILGDTLEAITKLSIFVSENAATFKFLLGVIISLKVASFLGPMFNAIAASLISARVQAAAFVGPLQRISIASRAATASLGAMRGIMAALGGPVGLIIAAAGALASWAFASSNSVDETKALNTEVEQLLGNYEDLEKARLKDVIDKQTEAIAKQVLEVERLVKANTAGGGPVGNIKGIQAAGTEYGRLVSQLEALKLKLQELEDPTKRVKDAAIGGDGGGEGDGAAITAVTAEEDRNKFLLDSRRNLLTAKEQLDLEYRTRKDELENISVLGTIEQQVIAQELIEQLDSSHKKKLEKAEIAFQKKKLAAQHKGVQFAEQLRAGDFKSALGTAQALTQGLARTSKEAFEINKAASIGSAIINTYEGFTAALKLPFPYNLVAAGTTLAAGFGQVNAIRSTSYGGGGGGGGGSYTAPSFAGGGGGLPSGVNDVPTGVVPTGSIDDTATGPTQIDIDLGDDDDLISKAAVRKLMGKINDALGEGVKLNI